MRQNITIGEPAASGQTRAIGAHVVAELATAVFEICQGASCWLGCVAAVGGVRGIFQHSLRAQHVQNLPDIRRPVGGAVQIAAGVTNDSTAKVKAGELVNLVAGQVGGKGGGKADMAMAGGTEPAKLAAALASGPAWVAAKL